MGLFDRARRLLGLTGGDDEREEAAAAGAGAPLEGEAKRAGREHAAAARSASARGLREGRRGRPDRPPLPVPAEPGQGLDDALAARDAGDRELARRILRDIDRGGGLRTVIRAAAALEAGDEDELRELLPAVAALANEEPWRLPLQIAAALGDASEAGPHLDRAAREGAPAWAIAWARALSADDVTRREGLVDLLFADHALARTVAARDLGVAGATADPDAAERYASFAHGRDCIRRFGAATVATLFERALRAPAA